jgi:6-phosphogluconolactonase
MGDTAMQRAAPPAELPSVQRLGDADAVARHAAAAVAREAREAIAARGVFTLVLAGGDTPKRLYERLVGDREIDWPRVEFFWGDERAVPPTHPDSNFGMSRAALLDPLCIDPRRVHRIEAERADLDAAARDYERELARIAGGEPGGTPPALDLVLLGMGADGHMASLFPYTEALSEARRWVVANDVPALASWRITATFPLLDRARTVLVLVTGAAKAAALAAVLEGPWDPERLPSQRLRTRGGRTAWCVDAAAASGLHSSVIPGS